MTDAALSPADAAVVEQVVKDFQQMVQSASKDFDLEGTRLIASEVIARPLIRPLVALVVAARAETAAARKETSDTAQIGLGFVFRAEQAEKALAAMTRERDGLRVAMSNVVAVCDDVDRQFGHPPSALGVYVLECRRIEALRAALRAAGGDQ